VEATALICSGTAFPFPFAFEVEPAVDGGGALAGLGVLDLEEVGLEEEAGEGAAEVGWVCC
jgi:hypothetical protein